jgi:hypothetical protein
VDISSPLFVVSAIVIVFTVAILFAASTKEDEPSAH